jgi:hypothetical protein
MSDSEFVRVAVLDSETEMLNVKTVLEDNKIETRVSGLEPSALGISLDGADAIELFVRKVDYETARELIDTLEEEEEEVIPAWTCECGEEVDEGFFVCWSCGKEYTK